MEDIKATYSQASEVEIAPKKGKVDLAEVDLMLVDTERTPEARGLNIEDVPRSYWFSARFLGSFLAVILAKDTGSGGFSLAAPILTSINHDIGPSPNITWVSLSWVLCQGIGALIVGRLSDIFGRRWIFIAGSIIGLIGSIFASQAQTVNQLIGATVILGIGGGIQINYFWVISEIVPMKFRYLANAVIYGTSFTTWMGPKIAYTFQTHTSVKWRGVYYLLIGLNSLSVLAWYAFYFPPTFKMLHRRKAAKDLLLSFDWIGLVLYIGGTLVFLMGLTWGGGLYPCKSAHVIGAMIADAAGVAAFIVWEIYLPRRSESVIPFVAMHYFLNFKFMAITIMTGIGASAYYPFSAIWPAAVLRVYTDLSNAETGNMLGLVVMSFLFSQMIGGFIAHFTGPKPAIIVAMMLAGPLFACVSIDPMNMSLTMGLIFIGCFCLGVMEGVALTTTTFPLRTQEEIGTAGGLSGTIRLFLSKIATAIYSTALNNRLATTIPANVDPAATNAGLPSSSIPDPIKGLREALPLNSTTVPGINHNIEEFSRFAYRLANAQVYRTVFLVSFAFTGPGMILCWFTSQNDRKKEGFVAGHIHKKKDEKALEEQQG